MIVAEWKFYEKIRFLRKLYLDFIEVSLYFFLSLKRNRKTY